MPPPDVKPGVWVDAARKRVLTTTTQEFMPPSERDAPSYVPQLRGRDRFGTMLRVGAGVAAIAAFAAGFLLLKPR